ncbi:aspartyl/asparaginyl beta-hydroxylase-like [Pseudoliparis swirei]|uniref:aspartyl/asparaginyl beta-hydroxylase-like n=1 Tax=Pseudoliparis swirei TaxID=2059687 RepID=UPI0024BE9B46|nr:aspartyl/asparaginyl beta-hydroxylase-like [Pseudoliparis swirei]
MQRYRHYGTSPPPPPPVEEIHAEEQQQEEEEVYTEEEVYEEEAEPLIREEAEPVVQVTGVKEEEVEEEQEEVQHAQKTEGKTTAEGKAGKRTEREGGAGGAGGDAPGGGGDAPGGGAKYSMLTWFVVLALLGVWSSVAVVYFDIVDYDSVLARAKEFHMNFTEVLQGKLTAYDADGDGDFDVEDAKVLLGLKAAGRSPDSPERTVLKTKETSERPAATTNRHAAEPQGAEPTRATSSETRETENDDDDDEEAAVPLPSLVEEDFVPDDSGSNRQAPEDGVEPVDTTGVLVEERPPEESQASGAQLTSSRRTQEAEDRAESAEPQSGARKEAEGTGKQAEEKIKEKAKKKKKPLKMLNELDKTIKAEIDAAEKLRKKGKLKEALRAFEALVQQNPQSPRALYGKAQAEDDLAEKQRSNELLLTAISSYRDAAELPDVTSDLLRAALKRRAERQQFLGRIRGSLMTLEKLVQVFPEDVGLKNEVGVAHLLLGDNKGAKKVFEEVLVVAPSNGFAKVHYGFVLKSENKIEESVPYLKEGLESGAEYHRAAGFASHLGETWAASGRTCAYHWYELGHQRPHGSCHQRGHFASVWQRSLYNVDGLKAQPWWTPQETGYTDLVRALERNWKLIREEALSLLDQETSSFLPEEENLRERGEWGQYTLWQQVGGPSAEAPPTGASPPLRGAQAARFSGASPAWGSLRPARGQLSRLCPSPHT